MPTFPSTAWMDAYGEALAAHPDAATAAAALDGVYRFVVTPSGPVAARHSYDMRIRPDGEGASVVRLDPPEERPRLELLASFKAWKGLISGDLGIQRALLLRHLRLHGDVASLRRNLDDAQPLIEALQQVETEWMR